MPFFTGTGDLLQLNQESFDFNVQFEQLFFSVIPSALFIVTSVWRTVSQARKPTVVNASTFKIIKLGAIIVYVALELTLLILVAVESVHVTSLFLSSSVLKLVSALFMITLSIFEHSKSPRPSVLLNSYLFLTLLLDATQVRTLFLSSGNQSEFVYSSIFSAVLALKVGILFLEAKQKSQWVDWRGKDHSPEETSGIFSLGVFSWLNRIFLEGYKKVLTMKDLYPLDGSLDGKSLHENFSRNLDKSKFRSDKYGVAKVLIYTLKVHLLLPIPLRLALVGFTLCQPLFIEKLVEHLSKPKVEPNTGYGLIGANVLIYTGIAISTALCWYFHNRMQTMTRSILVTEIYIKATKARMGSDDDSAALTLMSTDVERIIMGLRPLHDIWASFVQVALAGWMLYNRLGAVFAAPIGVVITCFVGLGILMQFTGNSQRAWMARVQKRVGITATTIANMKNLKMSGLSAIVSNILQKLRVEELAAGSEFRKVSIAAAVFGYMPMLLGPVLTFAFAHQTLDATRIFTSLAFLTLLTYPLSQVFQSIPLLLSALACLGRIQVFLGRKTHHDFREVSPVMSRYSRQSQAHAVASLVPDSDLPHPIVINNANFGWEADNFALRSVTTRISESSLTVVVGPVGSGKSTLCKALLGEIPFCEGNLLLRSRFPCLGFCDQNAFLSNGSIRDNIVGFSEFDNERYVEIIEATALGADFDTLEQGDRTSVGSEGIALSGGQKQRVSLARALYLQSGLLVLDDVLSGLDADTEEHVFQQVFGPEGLLKRRRSTVVLCTHSVKYLPTADHIIALEGGTVVEQGSFDQLMTRQGYVQRLKLRGALEDNTSFHVKAPNKSLSETKSRLPPTVAVDTLCLVPNADGRRQVGDKTVYMHYIKSLGSVLATSIFSSAVLWGFFTNFPTIWLKYWSDDAYSENPAQPQAFYAGIYALLQVCAMVSLFLLGITIFIVSIKKAGARLHQDALHTLMRAPLRFFTVTDTGIVTNLFSQDLNLIDTELPNALLSTLFCVFWAIGQAAVMLTSSPFLAISYPFLGALLYLVQRVYLRTSRQLRLLDLEAKSPLYTHFLDTLRGIATLRASGFIHHEIQKNARLIDSSQRPAYLLIMCQQWLNLVLGLIVTVMAAVLTTIAVELHSKAGFAGASLVTLMSFGESLSGIVIWWTRLETSMGAIARLKTFNDIVKPEDRDEEDIIPADEWPQSGMVELNGVSATYEAADQIDRTSNFALRDINLQIKSGEKIAVCGRTGSGKSSLIALLLKLLDPLPETAENVTIDHTPLHRIDRLTLRQRILAVPQEAAFLPDESTFRANMDSSNVSTPEECQSALAAVGLWQFVQERGGLDAGMSVETLSAGQRQLLSLGRTVLRRRIRARSVGIEGEHSDGGLLLLDEVSSSVDQETERLMQDIIKIEFRHYTVVAVSHRLDMIMDFDRVVILDKGEIQEIGKPTVLAKEEGSRFHGLLNAGMR